MFSIFELHDIYTNLKDGNYWTAVRKLATLLNALVNPTTGKASGPVQWTDTDAVELDDICSRLESFVWEPASFPTDGKLKAPNAPAVDPATIIMLVELVLQLVSAWRKRRNPPAPIPVSSPVDASGSANGGETEKGSDGNVVAPASNPGASTAKPTTPKLPPPPIKPKR